MPLVIDHVKTPEDISIDILSNILNNARVIDYNLSPLGRGVLSNVQVLRVITSTGNLQFIAKFRKMEIPLKDLFQVEAAFYHLVDELEDIDAFPFRLTKALATGSHWILLEYISENVISLDVHQSSPKDQFDNLIYRLAKMHEYCWLESTKSTKLIKILNKYSTKLADAPGVGQQLSASKRRDQFEASWPAVRKRLVGFLSSEALHYLDEIVKWTAAKERIEKIKSLVEENRYTLCHGDFHLGNILLSAGVESCDQRPWLLDWSFSGVGNPLVDLAFFLSIAMNEITFQDTQRVLQNYFNVIRDKSQLSWDQFLSMLRHSLLNQFVILVCYDSLCRQMADSSGEMAKVQHRHFDRVNTRCANLILLYNFKDGKILT